jgi:mannose-6-phosphate isomerase-like protein (cupin superfamily)
MERINEREREFRFKDSGPKYIFRGPRIEWGIMIIKPGESLGAHYHNEVEETFYFIEGNPKIIVNKESYRVEVGDAFRLEPGEVHDIINDQTTPMKAFFIKTPYNPEDKVSV